MVLYVFKHFILNLISYWKRITCAFNEISAAREGVAGNWFVVQGIEEMGFTMMTEIQAQTIPHLLEGRDLVGAAKTGLYRFLWAAGGQKACEARTGVRYSSQISPLLRRIQEFLKRGIAGAKFFCTPSLVQEPASPLSSRKI